MVALGASASVSTRTPYRASPDLSAREPGSYGLSLEWLCAGMADMGAAATLPHRNCPVGPAKTSMAGLFQRNQPTRIAKPTIDHAMRMRS